jgi:hypothetical protein
VSNTLTAANCTAHPSATVAPSDGGDRREQDKLDGIGLDLTGSRGVAAVGVHNRRKLVHLTDAGRQTAARARQILTEPPPSLAALSPEQFEALDQTLSSLATDSIQPPAEQA